MIDGIAANPFSAVTLPPIDVSDTQKNMEKVIRVSRERFGTKKEIVEDKINRWSGTTASLAKEKVKELVQKSAAGTTTKETNQVISLGDKEKVTDSLRQEEVLAGKGNQANQENKRNLKESAAEKENSQKKFFETNCWSCGTDIKVPFEPDGKRPTFCKECLKNYRREQARIQNELKKKEWQNQEKQNNFAGKQSSDKRKQLNGNNDELRDLIKKALLERNKNSKK